MHLRGLAFLIAMVVAFGGCVEQEPSAPTAEDLKFIKQHILKTVPPMKFKVDADLEGKVTYLGLDVDREEVTPGVPFKLTHYWQVKKAVTGWRLFVHLNDPTGKEYINADHKPIGGRYPVSFWKPGEIIRDEHSVTLPGGYKADKVIVHTGLWRGAERLKPEAGKHDGDKRVIAAKLPVKQKAKAPPPRKRLVAVKAAKRIKVDGKLDEPVWQKAASTGAFVNTLNGAPVAVRTEAKFAWDERFLYVAFDNRDTDVWSELNKRDDKLWTQEAVEIFIDANRDGKDYVELQVNPNGTIFDSYLASYRKNDNAWNSKMRAKVRVEGTLNKRKDSDQGWTVEIAVPWADAKGKGTYPLKTPPEVGDSWYVNLFRLDQPKKGPQLAMAWSPPLVGDFHKLDRFGELVFGDAEGKAPLKKTAAAVPPARGRSKTVVAPGRGAPGSVVKLAEPQRRQLSNIRGRSLMRRIPTGKAAARKAAASKTAADKTAAKQGTEPKKGQ